jgi:mono/diheme cytochrome c family protein
MHRTFLVLTLTGAALGAGAALAADETSAGRATYVRYCGACHGPQGRGDGVAGTFMRPKPPDLTQLARKNDGKFPLQRVIATIDGRETVRAHGDPDMPVWGEIFGAEAHGEMTRRAEVQGKLLLIAEYLRSIQEE